MWADNEQFQRYVGELTGGVVGGPRSQTPDLKDIDFGAIDELPDSGD